MEVFLDFALFVFLLDICLESCFGSETFGMDWRVVPKWGSSHSGTFKFYLSEGNPCYGVTLSGWPPG